jgi:hypothetical protein
VACTRACPTKAVRVRDGLAQVNDEMCIDCGACIEACKRGAVQTKTSSSADMKRFKHTVALPSLTLYAQFGAEVRPGHVLRALRTVGFDSAYDISLMCEMVAGATDAYLAECRGPWPKISVTCPAVVRLIQIKYPDLLPHLVPIESPRELAAKLRRRRLAAELGLDPSEIGMFFITPCPAIIHSIVAPVGLEASYLDGAFSISDLYGPLLKAIKAEPVEEPCETLSARGIRWAMAGGEISGMRNTNTMTVKGLADVTYVFDRIEAGTFQRIDFIEAYICSDGCVSGQLTVAGRYTAQHTLHQLIRTLGLRSTVNEEKVLAMIRDSFFDIEADIAARPVKPLAGGLRQAIARKLEKDALLARLPRMDCAACGAPDCDALAEDILLGTAKVEDCVFVRIADAEHELARRRRNE